MKFEEMRKIWNEQDQQHEYKIDSKQLYEHIQHKKNKASLFVSKMEWILIGANVIAGGSLLVMNLMERAAEKYPIVVGLAMLAAAIYIYTRRLYRLKHENRFDRTMLGDLDHAISNATYRARLSYGMLIYFVFIALLVIGNAFYVEKSLWKLILIADFFAIALFLGRWEYKSWHLADKQRLKAMREKLVEQV
ncbi:MAG: hypothetical protein KDC93_16810 [Cyclobacteriaceae bacterium]|nr:hypothetical protein [Cyclobacteriaceae bacterium]